MKDKLHEEVLKNVSGGTTAEIEELKAFIRTHDPDYPVNNVNDVNKWLIFKSGLSWDGFGLQNTATDSNLYVLSDSNHITHAELMAMLGERFPG